MEKLMNFFKDEEGATAVEYAVLLALIIAVCVGTYAVIGTESDKALTKVEGELQKANLLP